MSDNKEKEDASNNCFSPERQVKRARTDASSPIEINTKDRPIPSFVAGASPAKFITVGQLNKINDELANMAIAHEISMNPDFKVEDLKEQSTSDMTKNIEQIAARAFYDSIREKLNEDPPNYEPIFHLYDELIPMAKETVTPVAGKLFDQIDVDIPRRQHAQNCLDMPGTLLEFVDLLSQVCAPARDEEIKELRKETDLIDLFRGLHQLLKNMKNDMINFTIRQSRHQFLQHSAQFECEKFMKVLELYPNAADETQNWLNESLDEYLKNKEVKQLDVFELPLVMSIAYARLLEGKKDDITFPETLKYDMSRVAKLVDERMQISLTLCGVFIASNFAGKDVCEKTDFKSVLKTHLLAILQGVNKVNYESMLENVYLECNKQLEVHLKSAWTEKYSSILRSQIDALKNSESSSIRKLVDDRIFTVVSTVLQGPQSMSKEGTKLPPGIGLIETELVSIISRYISVTIHNMQSFGEFYLQRLNKTIQSKGQSSSTA